MSTQDSINQPNFSDKKEKIEQSFDTIGLLFDYLSHWKIFILSLIICLGVAYCYLKTIEPAFKVGASVYLNDDNATKTSVVSMSPMNVNDDMNRIIDQTEIEIMKSRNSLLKIVDTLDLAYSYSQLGKWRNIPQYKDNPVTASMDSLSLYSLKSSIVLDMNLKGSSIIVQIGNGKEISKTQKVDTLPAVIATPQGKIKLSANGEKFNTFQGTNRIVIRHPNQVAGQLAGNLSIQYAENAYTILNFTYNTTLPNLASDILDMLIYFYNRQIIEDKNLSAIQTEEFIQARVRDVQNELKEASNRVREYEERKNIIDRNQQISMDLSKSSNIQSEIIELRLNESSLRDALSFVRSVEISSSLDRLDIISATTNNSTINSLIEQFNKDVSAYNRHKVGMSEESEYISETIRTLQSKRNQIITSLERALEQVRSMLSSKQAIENRSTSSLASQPQVIMGYKELKLDEEVKNNILTFLLQRREEIALQKTLATPTAQFIDNPSVKAQTAPRTSYTYTVAFVIGLLIPAVLIFLKRLLFPKFKEKEDLQRVTSVPVIAEICKAEPSETDIVVDYNVSTSIAELFRLLRNNINFARTGGDKRVVLVTSSISGEGKTFISLNLAMTYALTGKRTVVIGLDIRRPVLAHKFGLSNRVGLTSYLADQVEDLDEIIYQTENNPNLFVIPAGPVPPNPNELLMSERMTNLFEDLRNRFDYVIVDTAPIGMVSDTYLIVNHTDIQLFVTRAAYSKHKSLKVLHEAIESGQLPNPYIILNSVNTRSRTYNYRRYGYYSPSISSYGYGYGYGYGHSNSKRKKRSLFKRIFGRK